MTGTSSRAIGAGLRVGNAASSIEGLMLDLVPQVAQPAAGGCLVEISHAAINPSDVKACLGLMPSAVFPRTPGRDFAGCVVEGPAHLQGKLVWGTGGDIGISRNGTHARYLWLERGAVSVKPERLTMAQAAGVGVPFVTAMHGYREAGGVNPSQTVLVLGANGKVGQAAVQIALWHGARVIAVTRGRAVDLDYIASPFDHLDASSELTAQIAALTGGRGADIAFNTVGSDYWELAVASLAKGGCQILISTRERNVPLDIFAFYRGRQRLVGVDSLALDCRASGVHLDYLRNGFENGGLLPFPIGDAGLVGLADWKTAYRDVLAGARERIIFDMTR